MDWLVGFPGAEFYMATDPGFASVKSASHRRLLSLIKKHMEVTGQNVHMAEFAVLLTPEGKAAWEEARRECLRRG